MGFKDRFRGLEPQNIVEEYEAENSVLPSQTAENSIEVELKLKLSSKIATIPVWFEYSEAEKKGLIKSFFENWVRESGINLSNDDKINATDKLYNSIYGFGALDAVLSEPSVTQVFIRANNPLKIKKNEENVTSDIELGDINELAERLKKAASIFSDKPVLKFGYRNLIITLVMQPVGDTFIAINKKTRQNTDFGFLLQHNKINENIYDFLISLINEKKNLLISGPSESGKTSYLESFYSAIKNSVLLQNTKFLEEKSYICGGLEEEELQNLISALSAENPEYLVYDFNNGYYNKSSVSAIISTVRADSPMLAVTKIASNSAARDKITEKQAKAAIGENFDYIIHLEENLFISSISEFSLNKAGSLVMTEILKRTENEYTYEFPEPAANKEEQVPVLASQPEQSEPLSSNSFKSRFK